MKLQNLYEELANDAAHQLEGFDEKDFHPCKGSILLLIPPPRKETEGGIHLPETAFERSCVGRVVAVPNDPACPVGVAQWVVFRDGSGTPLPFRHRQDLLLLNYTDGPDSEILGTFPVDYCPAKK